MVAPQRTPPTRFLTIWNMSFGFLGIQFGWALQMANMSAISEYLGASADQIPMLWLAATDLDARGSLLHSGDAPHLPGPRRNLPDHGEDA